MGVLLIPGFRLKAGDSVGTMGDRKKKAPAGYQPTGAKMFGSCGSHTSIPMSSYGFRAGWFKWDF
jgi:hypothetical protein